MAAGFSPRAVAAGYGRDDALTAMSFLRAFAEVLWGSPSTVAGFFQPAGEPADCIGRGCARCYNTYYPA